MRTNYNTNLPGFIIDVNHRIPEDSLVRKIDTVINQVPDEFFNKADRKVGRIGYPSRLMLKIILLAYAKNVFSGREIEKLLNTDLEIIWISQDTHMTYKTTNNFRSNRWVSKMIENLSEWLNNFLENKGSVKIDTAYIDGTIIAADTYKYGFIWKKSAKKFLEKLYLKL
ncbi:transposase [Ligilactobacillus equi]|uniref:Transposase n=1 Tax=Ligilactobacillus equi DPC 6820 TaxID=1392007 RepID=V7HSR7_9LACO|nr:transposase [Ligilactobacillus equi]ETA73269.1 transposase [Ligilactobacillus equi DPC 6820]